MYLGLDVGGTHTDAVLLDEKGVRASYKAVTDHANLLASMMEALDQVTHNVDKSAIDCINLSTTLSTNAIVERRLEDVAVLVSSGPGIDPRNFEIGKHYYVIPGSIDHRGTTIQELGKQELAHASEDAVKKGVRVFAAISKFSTRNPDQENQMAGSVEGSADFITLGHKISAQLGFPRRIATAYYNSAVWRIYNKFSDAIEKSIQKLGLKAKINILKADGGTMPLEFSRSMPVESILSGPAASILGIIALCAVKEDCVILDIGGTTTDIAIFADGAPLINRHGVAFGASPTHIRSLLTRSIGVGGDSILRAVSKAVTVGPERLGPSMAMGGNDLTLTDALNAAGIAAYGDTARSAEGIAKIAKKHRLSPEEFSKCAIDCAVDTIKREVDSMLREINEKPVYTIHEMLEGKVVSPRKVYVIGGPAECFAGLLRESFGLDVVVPGHFACANAVGAALARTTFNIELFADTSRGVLLVPNIDVRTQAPKQYSLSDAERDAKKYLIGYLNSHGMSSVDADAEILESSSFKMVQGWFSTGLDIRVKCQIKPGVLMSLYDDGGKS